MTPEEAREGVERIRALQSDDEAAHSDEDALYRRFVSDVAEGKDLNDAPVVASILMTTQGMMFMRWCA